MRSAVLRYYLLALFTLTALSVSAQDAAFKKRLDSLKSKDNLIDWIYDQVDYAALNPQENLTYLVGTKPWRKANKTEEHYAILNLLNSKGYYQLLAGHILASINSYESAYSYYLKNKVANYEIVEYTLKPLSNNYTRLGDYERALYLQQLSINFLIKTKDLPDHIASAYSNLAISYRAMGKLNEAEQSIQNGLKLVQTNSRANIMLNNILADILIDKHDYYNAAKLIEHNISKQKLVNEDHAYWLMSAYTTAGLAHLELKNASKANAYLDKALHIISVYFKGTRLREKANISTLKGRIKLLQNEPQLAIKDFKLTLSILKITNNQGNLVISNIYGDYKLVEVFQQLSIAYLQLKNQKEAFNSIKLALFSADKIRSEFVDDQTKERLQADLKNIAEKGIDLAYQLYQQNKDKNLLKDILELVEQSKARTLLDQIKRNQQSLFVNNKDSLFIKKQAFERAIIYNEKQELEAKSAANHKNTDSLKFYLALVNKQIKQKYKQFNFDSKLRLTQLLEALPKTRIIEYFVGENAIYLIDIKDQKLSHISKIDHADQLKSMVKTYVSQYFQQGPNAMLNAPKDFYLASYKIYQKLLTGITLAKNESLIIIPDGILGYLSFDGLITDDLYKPSIATWPFLIKRNTITYAFSLQTLTAKKAVSDNKKFTGFFITHQKSNNKPLKAIQYEANGIKKQVNGDFIFDEKANAKSFNTAFEESAVLHIGTHAYLSGKTQEPTLDFNDEKLFLFELGAKKNAPSLVVLSACRTADGLLTNGEGIISLSRGFNAVGTSATIAGLWNVNDVAAAVITSSLYQHILTGKSSGTALHQAKLDWLNHPQASESLYLPYYWDSLIYMGVDQPVELKTATNWWYIIGISTTLLIIGAIVLMRKKRITS